MSASASMPCATTREIVNHADDVLGLKGFAVTQCHTLDARFGGKIDGLFTTQVSRQYFFREEREHVST